MSTIDDPMLSIEDVSVEFDDETAVMEVMPERIKNRFGWGTEPVRAIEDVSIDIGEQDLVVVIGESGSGKTTLGKTSIGLLEPTSGTIRYRGEDIWELRKKKQSDDMEFSDARKALQIVHQDPGASLNPFRTITSSLRDPLNLWYPELSYADQRERIFSLFRRCGLTPAEEYEDRYPHELSGGEQQRVSLIRAMLLEPDFIFADEPVSKLDPSLGISLMDLMLELQEVFNTSYLFVTHDLQFARYITSKVEGSRIAVMYLGEIVEFGPAEEVLQDPKHPYTQVLKWATLPAHPDDAREHLESEIPMRRFDPPDVVNKPTGCYFHTRCPKARETCAEQHPEYYSSNGTDHEAACYLEDPNHEYWSTDFLNEEGEIEIPE